MLLTVSALQQEANTVPLGRLSVKSNLLIILRRFLEHLSPHWLVSIGGNDCAADGNAFAAWCAKGHYHHTMFIALCVQWGFLCLNKMSLTLIWASSRFKVCFGVSVSECAIKTTVRALSLFPDLFFSVCQLDGHQQQQQNCQGLGAMCLPR